MVTSAAVLGEYADPVCLANWERIASGFSGADVWKGSTDRGSSYVLKRWPVSVSPERLASIHQAQITVASLPFVPKLIPTRTNRTACRIDGRCWDMSTWLPGEAESEIPFTVSRRRAAVKALASIHHIWSAQSGTTGVCPAILRRLALIDDYHAWSQSHRQSIRDTQLADAADRIVIPLRHANRELHAWSNRPVAVHLCYTDLHREHVLFSGDHVTGMIDYGAVKPDNPAVDLARLFGDDWPTLVVALAEYGGATIPPGLAETLAATAAACNVAAWILRLVRDGDAVAPEEAVRQRISNWVDRLS